MPCDKNLGPAIIERHDYLKIAMRDHLNDTTTYKLLNQSEIKRSATIVKKILLRGLKNIIKYSLRWNENSSWKTHLKQSPLCKVLFNLKITQVEIWADGGPPEEQTHSLMPQKPPQWTWSMGRSQTPNRC